MKLVRVSCRSDSDENAIDCEVACDCLVSIGKHDRNRKVEPTLATITKQKYLRYKKI